MTAAAPHRSRDSMWCFVGACALTASGVFLAPSLPPPCWHAPLAPLPQTHFCDPCHKKAAEIETLRRKGQFDKFDKCVPGPRCASNGKDASDCPLGVTHAPLGDEFCIGCAACEEERLRKRSDQRISDEDSDGDGDAAAGGAGGRGRDGAGAAGGAGRGARGGGKARKGAAAAGKRHRHGK